MCRFASTTALAGLAAAFENAADLCDQYVTYFYQLGAHEAGKGPAPEGTALSGLADRVAKPLGEPSSASM